VKPVASLVFFSALLLTACTCSGAGPTAGGATPYVRCAMREPAVIDTEVGLLRMRSEGRVLTIEGATSPLRIAAFRGPALAEEPLEPALDAIESGRPALQIVIGSLGDDEAHVTALLRALASLATPTLVVMGGRDHPTDLRAALAALDDDARSKIVDASALRRIAVAGIELVPVAGAPDGRYARDDEACGLGEADASAIAGDVGEPAGAPRFVIAYAAPTPLVGFEGAEAGSSLVADVVRRTGARASLFAWPDAPSESLLPPLAGPPAILSDGARLGPGAILFDVGPEGMIRVH
jgi:hypothetical protein